MPEFDALLQGVGQGVQQAGFAGKVKLVTSGGDLPALQQITAAAQRLPFLCGAHGQFQHRPEQACLADRELSGMHADGDTARTRIEVVACQRALVVRIELALAIERQQVSWDDRAAPQHSQGLRGNVRPVHESFSNCRRVLRSGWVCRGSRRRAAPSPRSSPALYPGSLAARRTAGTPRCSRRAMPCSLRSR